MKELKEAARVALTDCMAVKKGENVVVVCDEPLRRVGLAFWETAREMGADAIFCEILPRQTNGEEPPRAVAALLRDCDVFVMPIEHVAHPHRRPPQGVRQRRAGRDAAQHNRGHDEAHAPGRLQGHREPHREGRGAGLGQGARRGSPPSSAPTSPCRSRAAACHEDTGIVTAPGDLLQPAGGRGLPCAGRGDAPPARW